MHSTNIIYKNIVINCIILKLTFIINIYTCIYIYYKF